MTSGVHVLQTLLSTGPMTRPEIAAATGLSKPTVSDAIRRLELSGLVRATGKRHGARGRSPVAYELSQEAGYVVAADIGGVNLRVIAADLLGTASPPPAGPPCRGAGPWRPRSRPYYGSSSPTRGWSPPRSSASPSPRPASSTRTPPGEPRFNIGQIEPFDLLPAHHGVPGAHVLENNVNCAARGEQRRGHGRRPRSRSSPSAPASAWASSTAARC